MLVQRMIDAMSRPLRRRLGECLEIWIQHTVELRRDAQRKIACERISSVSRKIFHRIRLEVLNRWRVWARLNTEIAKHRGRLVRRLLQRKSRETVRLYVFFCFV